MEKAVKHEWPSLDAQQEELCALFCSCVGKKVWGKADHPIEKENYPEQWKFWEDKILAPLLAQDADRIDFAAYEEF